MRAGIRANWVIKTEAIWLWLSVFLLPWQLRHTLMFANIGGGYAEYASWHIYASDIAIIGLLIWGSWCFGRRVWRSFPKSVGLPLAMTLIWMIVSAGWAVDWRLALITAAHWVLAALWCVYLVNRVEKLERVVWPLVWGMTLQAGWGAAQFLMNHSLGWNWLGESVLDPAQPGVSVIALDGVRYLRAYGLLPHPNLLGGMMVVGLGGVVWLASRTVNRKWLIGLMVMAGLLAMALVLSFSRMAWLLGIGLVVGGGIGAAIQHNRRLGWAVGTAVLMLVATGLWQHRLVAVRFDLSAELEQQSITERALGWADWQRLVPQYPRGTGVGNYTLALTRIEPNQNGWWYAPVHNIYLLMVGELGALGAAMWIWLFGAVGMWVWRQRKHIGWLLAMPMGVWLALGLTDHWPDSLQQGRLLFFMALALIILGARSMIGAEQKD